MPPTNNQPIASLDYLNQIAPKNTKKLDLFNQKPLILVGLIAIVLLILFSIVGSILSGGTKPTERLAARLTATAGVANDASSKIKSSALKAVNSNLKSQLTNILRDIEPVLAKDNLTIAKINKQVTASESLDSMLSTLEDARLNAVYDRTYASEMAYQLDKVLGLLQQINGNSSGTTKTFVSDAETNLTPIQKQFADFNAANL